MTVHNNQETLILYKNLYLYNGSRYKFYHNSRSYPVWLKNNSKMVGGVAEEPFTRTVNFQSISEPITIGESIKNCDEYTYGSITNDGKTYYFFVDDISTDAFKMTKITYTIDWWSTNWNDINCTKARLIRYNGSKPQYMPQPFLPYSQSFIEVEDIKSGSVVSSQTVKTGMFVFSFIDERGTTTPDRMMYGAFDITKETVDAVMKGTWQENCGIVDGNILGIFVVPLFTTDMLVDWESSSQALTIPYKMFSPIDNSSVPTTFVTFTQPVTSTEQVSKGIIDWYGTPVWECPLDITVYGFYARLELGVTSCLIRLMPYLKPLTDSSPNPELNYGSEVTGKGFCYSCRQATLFIDKGAEYDYRDRSFDKEMTRIQARRDNMMAFANFWENVGFGASFGGVKGAGAASVGGLIEEIATGESHKKFDPMIMDATRTHASQLQDIMSVVGDSISDLVDRIDRSRNPAVLIVYSKDMDDATKQIMNKDISTNGYYCNEITDNLKSLFGVNKIIVADNTVVEGACNLTGKRQVVERLMNGVEFI